MIGSIGGWPKRRAILIESEAISNPRKLRADYAASPLELRALMDGWADGLNYFLATRVSGNSFVAVMEFADRVRARAVTAGGESGDPASPYFDDEAMRYSTGNLRAVYYYDDELSGHTKRAYHP